MRGKNKTQALFESIMKSREAKRARQIVFRSKRTRSYSAQTLREIIHSNTGSEAFPDYSHYVEQISRQYASSCTNELPSALKGEKPLTVTIKIR